MRALSIMQPWASLIVGGPKSPGIKRTENRGLVVAKAARKLVGERIAIHASKQRDVDAFADMFDAAMHQDGAFFGIKRTEVPWADLSAWPTGAVIGAATLGRVFGPGEEIDENEARFYIGNDAGADLASRGGVWGLRFDDAMWLPTPIPAKGALGFWNLDAQLKPIDELIANSSIGRGLANIKENGIDAELARLDREMHPRRRR